jgi:hypothetical protein
MSQIKKGAGNFKKVFDKMEHEVILQVMRQKGFGERWIRWVRDILSTGTSSVLLHLLCAA